MEDLSETMDAAQQEFWGEVEERIQEDDNSPLGFIPTLDYYGLSWRDFL